MGKDLKFDQKGSALRYNAGKIRYNLIPENAKRELARVYTLGAHKYSKYKDKDGNELLGSEIPYSECGKYTKIYDGSNNWRNGTQWSAVMDSAMRHIEQFKSGNDFDELGTYHLSNAIWNLATILEYYFIYPQGDDRWRARVPRIGLDVDDVIADFCGAYSKAHELDAPKFWSWTYFMSKHISDIVEWEDFLGSLPRKINPDDMPFEPVCYITSRSARTEVTELWIEENGFACAPVVTVGYGVSKVEAARANGVEVFVDDNYSTYLEMNAAGICCYLMDAPHNQRYDVGARRIKSLKELPWFRK